MSDLLKKNSEYRNWISQVSLQFKVSQIKAASKVNEEMLRFYCMLGKDISGLKKKSGAGNEFYTTASADLKKELPEVKSFSATNLKYMQYFYDLYSSPQVVDLNEDECSPQLVDSINEIYKIPWGHHRYIIDKCRNDRDKALFFVRESLRNNWSRAVLLNFLDTNLYERQGKAITNFDVIAIGHDGYLDSVGKIIRRLTSEHVEQILSCPYNEISSITTKESMEEAISSFPEYNDINDYELINGTKFYMHCYGKGSQTLPLIHKTKENTKYDTIEDLIANGGALEDWYAMYILNTDGKWLYKKFYDKNFRILNK